MNPKKIAAILLVMLLLALTGCAGNAADPAGAGDGADAPAAGGGEAQAAAGDADGGGAILIGFSQDVNDIDWTQAMRDDIAEACAHYGVGLTTTDAGNSGEKQASDIEDLITLGVDVIIIQTYHADTIANAAQDAMDSGIPVIVLSSEIPGVEVTSLITVDAYSAGEMMGRYFMEQFPDGCDLVQLTGKEGSVVNHMRGEGFRDVIDPAGVYNVLAELSANYERSVAMDTMEDLLQAHGDSIQAVYCHNDDMALGAIQAIESMGYTASMDDGGIRVFSPADGLYPEVHDLVEQRKMVSGYYPTFGWEGVEAAIAAASGEAVERNIIVPSEVITDRNVDDYRRE